MSSQEKLSDLDLAWINVVVEISKKLNRDYQAELLMYLIARREGVTNLLDNAGLSFELYELTDILTRLSDDVFEVLIYKIYCLLYSQTYPVICKVEKSEFYVKNSLLEASKKTSNDVNRLSRFHTGGYVNPDK